MTQAVQGVHRVWLVFSGLAFLVCGLLLVARFSRSAAPPAAQMASPASGSVIQQPLSVPSRSAPPGAVAGSADRAGKPDRTPEPVEQIVEYSLLLRREVSSGALTQHIEQVDITKIKKDDVEVVEYLKATNPELFKTLKKSAKAWKKGA